MSDLKKYKCHKTVHAKPMSLGEFNALSPDKEPKPADCSIDGYFVVYNKDTEDHYESWSPKKQFDEGYSLMSTSEWD